MKRKEERESIDGSDIEVRAVFACGAIIRGSDRRGARSKQGLVNRTIAGIKGNKGTRVRGTVTCKKNAHRLLNNIYFVHNF